MSLPQELSAEVLAKTEFDEVAPCYGDVVNRGLAITGETLDYFARKRVEYVRDVLPHAIESVLDFGCGPAMAAPFFFEILKAKELVGIDPSSFAIHEARKKQISSSTFHVAHSYTPTGNLDLAYANTVFHHIPIKERSHSLQVIYQSLKKGGYLAFWENNPWNPGTRWVMSRIPFDKDAILLRTSEACHLIRSAGFTIERLDHLFIFPNFLSIFRPLEKYVKALPIGGQYLILAKKN